MADHEAAGAADGITVTGLHVDYGSVTALRGVDAHFPAGRSTAVMGPNGAGKSTLVKALVDLVPRTAGQVRFGDRQTDAVRRRIAYVPQHSAVDRDFPIDAAATVLLGTYPRLGWLRRPGRAERALAAEALEQVGMSALADRQIGRLSGGQLQRVFLARALAQRPRYLLLDEPFVGVDATSEQIIVDLLRDLRDGGATVVVVHHDFRTVADYFDRVLLLDGEVVAAGTVAEALTDQALSRAYRPPGADR